MAQEFTCKVYNVQYAPGMVEYGIDLGKMAAEDWEVISILNRATNEGGGMLGKLYHAYEVFVTFRRER